MNGAIDILQLMRGIGKVYDAVLEKPRKEYSLTQIETKVISFLSNHPDKNTAADISYIRMLPKGNVSQAVESLIKKDLLTTEQDENDKRKIRLFLTEHADTIVEEIRRANKEYQEKLYKNLTSEEIKIYMEINKKILRNVFGELEGGNETE